jgi:hypothetical protein
VRLAASDDHGNDTTNWHAEVLAFLNGLKGSGQLADWNQVAFLFRSVKNDKVVALARFLEDQGVPVFSPRSNMFFEREEIRLMIGALIFLFPQFPRCGRGPKASRCPSGTTTTTNASSPSSTSCASRKTSRCSTGHARWPSATPC